ncbi:hypothetical protein ROZALSC1DRAFT_24116 [Rozella allomycis CSF55]|uniref:Uncharacterized protein n=1 Tax=Rozella allomycis (strain CSF55) TaxID=988480 RepID=A0A4P9YDW6_ROZAC|nr:hypothetical protein ROZALSC1DRAFT_24116 [Rozella allomycis CSF55]
MQSYRNIFCKAFGKHTIFSLYMLINFGATILVGIWISFPVDVILSKCALIDSYLPSVIFSSGRFWFILMYLQNSYIYIANITLLTFLSSYFGAKWPSRRLSILCLILGTVIFTTLIVVMIAFKIYRISFTQPLLTLASSIPVSVSGFLYIVLNRMRDKKKPNAPERKRTLSSVHTSRTAVVVPKEFGENYRIRALSAVAKRAAKSVPLESERAPKIKEETRLPISLPILNSPSNEFSSSTTSSVRSILRRSKTMSSSSGAPVLTSRYTSSLRYWYLLVGIFIGFIIYMTANAFADLYRNSNASTFYNVFYAQLLNVLVLSLTSIGRYFVYTKAKSKHSAPIFDFFSSMTFNMFYRNSFLKLTTRAQFISLELAIFLWKFIFYGVRLTPWFYTRRKDWYIFKAFFANDMNVNQYTETIAKKYFFNHLAEEASIVSYILWLYVLRYGPNSHYFPSFSGSVIDSEGYTFVVIVMLLSLIIQRVIAEIAFYMLRAYRNIDIRDKVVSLLNEVPGLVPCCIMVEAFVISSSVLTIMVLPYF